MRAALLLIVMGSSAHSLARSPDTLRPHPREWLKDELSMFTGYHQGRFGFVELGIGRSIHGVVRQPFGPGYRIGAVARMNRASLVGRKVGGCLSAGIAMGARMIQYQEEGNGSMVIRPEIGIGILEAKVTHAYHINLPRACQASLRTWSPSRMRCGSRRFGTDDRDAIARVDRSLIMRSLGMMM